MLNSDLKNEVICVGIGTGILSAVTVLGFALCGYFSLPVLFGAVWGSGVTTLNFFLLAVTVQNASEKEDVKDAKGFIRISYTLRLILIAASIIIAIKVPFINYITALLPFLYERIVITALHLKEKRSLHEHNRA